MSLVHDREGVPHRATTRPHHEREDAGSHLHTLGIAETPEVGLQDVRRDETERVVVRA